MTFPGTTAIVRLRPPPQRAVRAAFTLVELLVAVSIILLLVSMLAAAVSGARGSQKKSDTAALIAKLDTIITQQYASYGSRNAPSPPDTNGDGQLDWPSGMTPGSYRAWYIRRNLISGDLPDRWGDVDYMWQNTDLFGPPPSGTVLFPRSLLTGPQRAYIGVWHQRKRAGSTPTPVFQGAECLFMIVMQGGIANCIDCGSLRASQIDDKDGDGAMEFQDDWGNPIGFILWPAAVEVPTGQAFFAGSRSLSAAFQAAGVTPPAGLGMRPLIYSGGPDASQAPSDDGEFGFNTDKSTGNLDAGSSPVGRDCGNPSSAVATRGAPSTPFAADNITNFDAEVTK